MTIFKVTTVEKNGKTYTNIKLKRLCASGVGMGLNSEKFKFQLMGRQEYNIIEGTSKGKPYTIISPLIKPLSYNKYFEENNLLNEKGCVPVVLPTSKAIEQAIRMSQQFETYEIGMKECSYVDKDGKTKDSIMFTIDLVPEEEEQKAEPKAEKTSEEPVSNQADNEEEFDIDF